MDNDELLEVCEKHDAWLKNLPGGKRAKLGGVCVERSTLRHVSLRGADLRKATFVACTWSTVNLAKADLREVNFSDSVLVKVTFRSADMRKANLRYTTVYEADLVAADLSYADLFTAAVCDTSCTDANFCRADLTAAEFDNCDLTNTVFSRATLNNVNFNTSRIGGTNFEGTRTIVLELPIWRAVILPTTAIIGCQEREHQKWADISDAELTAMHPKARKWWRAHGPLVLAAIEVVKAQPKLKPLKQKV